MYFTRDYYLTNILNSANSLKSEIGFFFETEEGQPTESEAQTLTAISQNIENIIKDVKQTLIKDYSKTV